jgi:BlaI family penicillinase repressor
MRPFWERGPLAARDVYAALPKDNVWAYKTLKTLLSRLVSKGALTYDQVGNSYLYKPVYTREELAQDEVKGFVNRVLDGAFMPLLAHFIESKKLSGTEVDELRSILEKKSS